MRDRKHEEHPERRDGDRRLKDSAGYTGEERRTGQRRGKGPVADRA